MQKEFMMTMFIGCQHEDNIYRKTPQKLVLQDKGTMAGSTGRPKEDDIYRKITQLGL